MTRSATRISARHPSRRDLLGGAAAATGLMAVGARAAPTRGGTLIVGQSAEPAMLTTAFAASEPATIITPKIFDGLLTYGFDMALKPQLATSWNVSSDGLEIRFALRPDVRWHDGKPFTAADVNFSLVEIWKKHNPRGRTIFAAVVAAEAPDPLTIVWKLSKPAPYILYALASQLSQILPKHLYEDAPVPGNPANLTPVGTGPFKFAAWERGNFIRLVRNDDYWDAGKPHLDQVIYRILPDAGARTAALEAGDVQLVGNSGVGAADLDRLAKSPDFEISTKGYEYIGLNTYFMFNLDRPALQDVRVRRAIAHAINRRFLIDNIWFGYASQPTGAFSPTMQPFFSADGASYDFDTARATALLDEAGLPKGTRRLAITHDFVPLGEQYALTADYVRAALARIGIAVEVRNQDLASYVRRIYTSRDFDTANYLLSTGPDPAIGIQRIYSSAGFQPGVPFSNGAHFVNAEVDRLLELAQEASDQAKRREHYVAFQRIVQTELPQIPLVAVKAATIASRRLKDHTVDATGVKGNFADAYLTA